MSCLLSMWQCNIIWNVSVSVSLTSRRTIHPLDRMKDAMSTQINKSDATHDAVDDAEPDKPGIQSLARAFSILEAIAEERDGIGLANLSKSVNLHNSTTFHLVKTMVKLGYVHQDKQSKRYRLGRPLYQLAAATMGQVQLANVSKHFVGILAERTGETAHFAVPSQNSVFILSKVDGTSAFRLSEGMGAVRPSHCTAIGKVILAYLEPDQLQRYFASASLDSYTPATITSRDRLTAELETIRAQGIAFDDAEYHPELRCAAVPVLDMNGELAGSLGISGAVWRLSFSVLQSKVSILQEVSGDMSAELGHRSDV